MSLVITRSCCADTTCIAVCPVQCIRPRPGDDDWGTTEQLYIDPTTCIECGACAQACPVDAIVLDTELDRESEPFATINAEYFAARPLGDVSPLPIQRRRPAERGPLRVAIVGTGPSAMYAAEELSELRGVEVSIFERLPVPFGLIRSGVAPDHDRTKRIGDVFARIFDRRNVSCWFNTEIGRDLSMDEIRSHHDAVIVATGAPDDRALGVPGEALPGSHGAREFVAWYNGHPDYADRDFDLQTRRAVIIGNGNVALDIARALTRPSELYERTSMADHAIRALERSAVEEVHVVARRGPAFAAHSTAELTELAHLSDVELLAESHEIATTAHDEADALLRRSEADLQRRLAIVADAASKTPSSAKKVVLRYRLTPTRITGTDRVDGIVLTRPDGTVETIETSLVLRAIGFHGRATPGLPFDAATGTIPSDSGRVVDPETGERIPGVYCTGWIKRGPSGVIGTNRIDSAETVAALLADHAAGMLPAPTRSPAEFARLVEREHAEAVTGRGWRRIDERETDAGAAQGRPRVPFVSVEQLLAASRAAATRSR
ncbi:FAD-dependent oxidoreductase [Agromyces silvae]|uniref:FAD-dependent oxidoreductase n=1 Tax=Agromyces silvae TaxID=3388266 RepID=UPI00280AA215|nr:FAD-dependent oxidoreductase [Agromyces protaetiae]